MSGGSDGPRSESYDAVIVGGGPAGLSAALLLGRCRRRVIVIDSGVPRNRAARASHGLFTRDGASPAALLRRARSELRAYPTVTLRAGTAVRLEGTRGAFQVGCADGTAIAARRVLLATGIIDHVPEIAGLVPLYGTSVHHCPYCDAFEHAGRPLAQYGRGRGGVDAALTLRAWSDDVVLLTDGVPLGPRERARCARHGVAVRTASIRRLVGRGGRLERIVFTSGNDLPRSALFFATGQSQRSSLARRAGCDFNAEGAVLTSEHETTSVPGLYVAGDASHGEQKIVVAASEGAQAAIKIHESLWTEELRAGLRRRPWVRSASR
ncbi:MAG TPA: NAD(P)/FAD-dependent oxidoreductase [Candidatus Limnocylindria bacterium]